MINTTDYRTGKFLIDMHGGLQQFPRDAGGIYLIEHEPTGECYIGATGSTYAANFRKRITDHLKPTPLQSPSYWVPRFAKRLMRQELMLPGVGRGIDYSPDWLGSGDTKESFEWAIRRNCTARVLEILPNDATKRQIRDAESHWIAELKPTLVYDQKSNYPR